MSLDTRAIVDPAPAESTRTRSGFMSPNAVWALAGGAGGYALGHFCGNVIAANQVVVQGDGQNNVAVVLGLSFAVLGWLAGAGMFNYPAAKLIVREPLPQLPSEGWTRYFKPTLDH